MGRRVGRKNWCWECWKCWRRQRREAQRSQYLARYFGGVFDMQEGWCDLQASEVPALHGLFKVLLIFFLVTARRRRKKKSKTANLYYNIFIMCKAGRVSMPLGTADAKWAPKSCSH